MKKSVYYLFLFILISCQEKSGSLNEHPIETKKSIDSTVTPIKSIQIDSSLLVIDTSTNLIWMKNDFSVTKERFLTDWNEIFKWQQEVNAQKYAGYNDWRVPTIKEYRTINKNKADREKYTKAFNSIDSVCVWGKGPYAFWSSTTPNKNTASYMSFIDGFATSGDRSKQYSNPYSDWKGVELGMSVRLVRENK